MQNILSHFGRSRARRLELNKELLVKSRTIGGGMSYDLFSENISKSGLLLSWNKMAKIPFLEKTILDMVIDPYATVFDTPIKCLGKVVRRTGGSNSETTSMFGIRIVQMDTDEIVQWEKKVSFLEKNYDSPSL